MRASTENIGLGLSIITAIVFVSAAFGIAQSQISNNANDIQELEEASATDHDILLEVRANVKWIREHIATEDKGAR